MNTARPLFDINDIIIHGHSSKMTEIKDAEATLILTSPPYFPPNIENQLVDGFELTGNVSELAQTILSYAWDLRSVFEECFRILKPGGHLILQTRDVRLKDRLVQVEAVHREICEAIGLNLYARHFWRPTHITLPRRRMLKALADSTGPVPFDPEVFLVFKKPGNRTSGDPSAEDLELLQRDFTKSGPGSMKARHKYQSPLPMIQAFIRTYSKEFELVVDPFAGGGTVALCAIKLNRVARTYEIDIESVNLARKNLMAEVAS